MKHPNESILALHAGGDLGFWKRWTTERHLAKCDLCRDEVAAFEALREISTELAETPEVPWNRLAAEMKANIRLGLAAGECVRTTERPMIGRPWFVGLRAAVALGAVVVLLFTGLVLEKPTPANAENVRAIQPIAGGIQFNDGGHAFRLMNTGARNVTLSVGAEGSMGARYVDPETGYVTVNHVYAE